MFDWLRRRLFYWRLNWLLKKGYSMAVKELKKQRQKPKKEAKV